MFGAFAHLVQELGHVILVYEVSSAFGEREVVAICLLPLQIEMEVPVEGDAESVDVATRPLVRETCEFACARTCNASLAPRNSPGCSRAAEDRQDIRMRASEVRGGAMG